MDWITLGSVVLLSGALGAFLSQRRELRELLSKAPPGQQPKPTQIEQSKRILVTYINKDGGHTYYYDGQNELQAKQGWYRGMVVLTRHGGTLEYSVNGVVIDRKSNL